MSTIEALLNGLGESPGEREAMGFALRLLAWTPAPVEPPFGLRERIEAAVHQPGGARFTAAGASFARATQMDWQPLTEGVATKTLHGGDETGGQTVLVRVAPNCPFPWDGGQPEHLHLLEGELWAGEVQMRAGDHRFAPAGTANYNFRAGRAGALFILVTR